MPDSDANTTGLVLDPLYKEHRPPSGHPERPARYDAVLNALAAAKLTERLAPIPARDATRAELALCHTEPYLNLVDDEIDAGATMLSTGDAHVSGRSAEVARRAAGGALQAVDAVIRGTVGNAFCVLRPPGHHATADRGMGFCIYNNVALAARYAQAKHGVGKVLIADWDVHHGNGTQEIFYEDPSVFFFSTHQYPLYPGTGAERESGAGKGLGTTLNCPLPAGSGGREIRGAFQDKLIPAARKFKPELILISAGFDSREGDPLGGFQLTDDDFAELTWLLLGLAREFANGRVVSVLEGGYSLDGLGKAAAAHVRALSET